MKYFGQDLVAWRAEDGTVTVMSAHCEHLGAHLGYGGRVEGDRIICPFHGWEWNQLGRDPYFEMPDIFAAYDDPARLDFSRDIGSLGNGLPAASRRSPADELGPKALRTVQSILDNARELFLDRGYVSTSVEDITSAAGVSRATFWTYFATKQDVLRSLGENIEEEGLAVAREFAKLPTGATLDEVTGWVRTYLEFLDTYGAFLHASSRPPTPIPNSGSGRWTPR